MTGLAILGSTGSIGCNTLDVVERLAPRFTVVALAAGHNVERLADQVLRHRPQLVAVADAAGAQQLRARLGNRWQGDIATGVEGMLAVAAHPSATMVMSAVVGGRGLLPTLRAIELGRRVCIANKEPLVMAGELMMRRARECGAEVLPVDSEHNALHQCLRGNALSEVQRLVLTASGGPFRTLPAADIFFAAAPGATVPAAVKALSAAAPGARGSGFTLAEAARVGWSSTTPTSMRWMGCWSGCGSSGRSARSVGFHAQDQCLMDACRIS